MKLDALARDRRLWIALAALFMVGVARLSGLADLLSFDGLRVHRETLVALVRDHALIAGLAYVAIYATAVALSLPGAVFLTLAGGFLFGAAAGTAYTVVGATVGATLVFLFARALLGENALHRFGAQAAKLAEGVRRNAASYLLVLRLVPLFPFFLVNLVPAFVGVRLSVFVLTTFFGIIPGTAVFSLAGSGIGAALDQGAAISASSILTGEIMLGLVGLAALSLAAIPVRKWLDRKNAAGPS